MKTVKGSCVAFVLATFVVTAARGADLVPGKGIPGAPSDAISQDAVWQQLQNALRPPPPPAEWRTNPPSERLIAEYERRNGALAGAAADKAKEFYTRFPDSSKADEARKMELQLLNVAIKLGDTNRQTQLKAAREKRLSDAGVSADEKFDIRAQHIVEMIEDSSINRADSLAKAEKAAGELQDQFPKRDEASQLLLMIAQGFVEEGNLGQAGRVAQAVVNKAGAEAKGEAEALLRKIARVGKPLQLKFNDLTGKQIDLKNYAGKVVLVDFWATWCGPCVAALPEVKETYGKLHTKGFEILGLSLDKDKEALTKFVAAEKMPWPQYFDGLGWENKFTQEFEITGIPTMWLIDKKGNVRDLNANQALASKVEKLLAEQ